MITFLVATTISCRIHKFYAWILKVILFSVQLKDQFEERRKKNKSTSTCSTDHGGFFTILINVNNMTTNSSFKGFI
jgi:hypothetical protein